VKYITLQNGRELPMVGFGTYRIGDNNEVSEVIKDAYEAGYRLFDSASYYKNEAALQEAFLSLGIREEVMLTSKVWNDKESYDAVTVSFAESEAALGDIDIYMLHWPAREFVSRWKALEDLYESGRVKAIGVSNFKKHHLETLLENARIKPMINQIEAHVYFMDWDTINFCKDENIAVQAWRPLMRTGNMLSDTRIAQMAARYEKSVAQICLKFLLQSGIAIIPKSVNPLRMQENIDLFDFTLTEEDMAFLYDLNAGLRTSDDPDTFFLPQA
jgi:diketogulonate reductase-like aldo/keto reductase